MHFRRHSNWLRYDIEKLIVPDDSGQLYNLTELVLLMLAQ